MAKTRSSAAEVVARLSKRGVVTSETADAPLPAPAEAKKPKGEKPPKATAKPPKPPKARTPAMPSRELAEHLTAGAGVVVAPDVAARVVERALASGDAFEFAALACQEIGLAGAEILVHPAFVRAAARRGLAFYAGPNGRVRRFAITMPEDKQVTSAVPAPVEWQAFYLKPPWFDDLAGFVDRGEPVLLIGPAGAGKSEAVERVFADRQQPLRIVSCTQRMTANDLEGAVYLVVEDGHQVTQFVPADPAIASQEGHGLLLDEADAAPAEAMYAVYRLLAGKPMHILRKGVDAVIPRHEGFRVVGTQNTEGRGDDRGLYHGRSYQDEAFLDRWMNTIRVDYPPKEDEVLILRKRTGISATQAERIVDVAQAARAALRHDDIMLVCTMRRTLTVAGNIAAGMTPKDAWSFAVLNRAIPSDVDGFMEVLNRVYGDRWRKR